MTGAELLQRLDDALSQTAADVELSSVSTRHGMTRLAGSRVTQPGDVEDVIVRARVIVDGRVGSACTNRVSREGIGEAIRTATRAATAQPRMLESSSVPPSFADHAADNLVIPPARFTDPAALRAEWAAAAIAKVTRAGFVAAGCASTIERGHAVATSRGCRRAQDASELMLDVVAHEERSIDAASGRASFVGDAAHTGDAIALAAEAIESATLGRRAIELPAGRYDVVLEPRAVAELIEWLALTSFGAQSIEDGSSLLANRIGETVLGEVDLYDDPLAGEDGCPRAAFDAEGTLKRRLAIIDRGVARGVAHDRATAARAKTPSTGHAVPLEGELFDAGPTPRHLHMAAGASDLSSMVGKLERGLVVKRFHYVNGLLDPRRALMTGMTRDGLFLVENGRVSTGVRNLRWTESLVSAFQRIDAVSRARAVVAAGIGNAFIVCPALLVRNWNFAAILDDDGHDA